MSATQTPGGWKRVQDAVLRPWSSAAVVGGIAVLISLIWQFIDLATATGEERALRAAYITVGFTFLARIIGRQVNPSRATLMHALYLALPALPIWILFMPGWETKWWVLLISAGLASLTTVLDDLVAASQTRKARNGVALGSGASLKSHQVGDPAWPVVIGILWALVVVVFIVGMLVVN